MDKTPQQLDPKLKEAYDRVMGTVVPPQPAPQAIPVQNQAQSAPAHPSAQATPPTLIPQEKSGFARKKKGISPLILLLGVIVFLIIYTVVWIQIFGVKLF
jgi:hypothetical protein